MFILCAVLCPLSFPSREFTQEVSSTQVLPRKYLLFSVSGILNKILTQFLRNY